MPTLSIAEQQEAMRERARIILMTQRDPQTGEEFGSATDAERAAAELTATANRLNEKEPLDGDSYELDDAHMGDRGRD